MIQFFDTLAGKLRNFEPILKGEVRMYTCGPTVYDYAHIGNFRAFVFEDLLRRFLLFKGFKVKHVMNITDVDDKTIAGANRESKKLDEFTENYIQAFHEDLKTLNIFTKDNSNYSFEEPRATKEIPAMIELIKKLVDKGVAYVSEGSVYYRVADFRNYGNLSKKKLEKNIKGARVDVDEYEKEEGSDFVLWKKAKEGEPSWDSPWGKGRPGWHIECSAMSMKYLGEQFDIHAGGEDLIFPHHENEIAQSEGATHKAPFVKYWLHCKFLLAGSEKMSKSKGNFYTLRDLIAKGYDPMAIRYALLCVHYRSPLNFTLESLKEAAEAIKKLDQCYSHCLTIASFGENREKDLASEAAFKNLVLPVRFDKMLEALADDLNISAALAVLQDAVKTINSWFAKPDVDSNDLEGAIYFFRLVDKLLGFDIAEEPYIPKEKIEKLEEQINFRKKKEFAQADKIRETFRRDGWWVNDPRPGSNLSSIRKMRRAWDR